MGRGNEAGSHESKGLERKRAFSMGDSDAMLSRWAVSCTFSLCLRMLTASLTTSLVFDLRGRSPQRAVLF